MKKILLSFTFIPLFLFIVFTTFASQPTTGTWTSVGLNNHIIHSIMADPNNANVLYAGTAGNGIFKSTDSGKTWNPINNGLPTSGYFTEIVIDPNNSNVIYAGGVGLSDGSNTGIFKSVDAGATWGFADNGITDVGFGGPPADVYSMIIDPNNPNTLYAAIGTRCGSVYKTTDGANTWTRGIGLPCDPTVVRLDPLNTNVLYARSAQGINKSIDGGVTWSNISDFGNNSVFYSLAIDPFNPTNLYANTNDGIYKSTDSGVTWILSNGDLKNVYKGLIVDPVRPNFVYAGENLGIETSAYMTSDGGSTWINITNNLPDVGAKRLLVPTNNSDALYTGTDAGVYIYGLTPISIPTPTPTTSLNVPLLKQGISPFNDNDPYWEGHEFDHANAGQFSCGKTMAQCGCATTSVAMVLKYYGINQLPTGDLLDPGSLNRWLKDTLGGYNRNLGINWGVAATVAHKAKHLNPNFQYNSLEVDDDWTYSSTQLKNDLEQGMPGILQTNTLQGTHFVVAKGIDNNKFTINDPFYARTSLSSYGDTAASMRRFVPANSDMSYISFAVDEGVEITVKDHNGNNVGRNYLDYGPGNPTEEGTYITPSPLTIFTYAKPQSGTYHVELNSTTSKNFQLDMTLITQEGDITTETIKGTIDQNAKETLILSFDKQSTTGSNLQKNVTFESTLDDIKKLRELGLLHFSTAISTTALINNAERLHEKGKDKQAEDLINVATKLIQKSPTWFVDPVAKEILLYDLNELKKLVQN